MNLPWQASDRGSNHTPYTGLLACNDEQLAREMQSGNNDAFAVFFRRYQRLVHTTALRILRDAGEAEDLTQSVFLEIYRKLGQFDPARGTLKVWLLQFAYSRSMSRRNYLQARGVSIGTGSGEFGETSAVWEPMCPPSQEATLLTQQILAVLPHPQRETIRMFFFQGLTLKEIAEQRQETFANVRHHYYRGLQRLRTILENGLEEADSDRRKVSLEVRRAEA